MNSENGIGTHYNLGFISDKVIFEHVRATVVQYRRFIDLKSFNQNLIDPIKLVFDAKVYGQSIQEAVAAECLRQIDKSNNNKIGYFHQYLFKSAGNGWIVPDNGEEGGFDLIHPERHIFVEIKNKHNTLNASSASDLYIKMQNKILKDDQAVCYLVEVIAQDSDNKPWKLTINRGGRREAYAHERIRRISMDLFYALVFEDSFAFSKLCRALPSILEDVVAAEGDTILLENSVLEELQSQDLYNSLCLLAFGRYVGFREE